MQMSAAFRKDFHTSGALPYCKFVFFKTNHCFFHFLEILVLFISHPVSSFGRESSSLCTLDDERFVKLLVLLSVASEEAIAFRFHPFFK